MEIMLKQKRNKSGRNTEETETDMFPHQLFHNVSKFYICLYKMKTKKLKDTN